MSEIGIVLGGSGFIGTHLLQHLHDTKRHGHLISIDRAKAPVELQGVQYETIDLRNQIPRKLGAAGATIYNLVALRNFPGHPTQDYYDVNVTSTQRAIDFAEETGAATMVFTSTMSIYGPGEDPKTEASPLAPVNPYGHSKLIGEVLNAGWLARNPQAKLVTCRPAVIFGYRDNGNYTRLARSLEKGYFVYVGRRSTIKSAGYVGDLVRSFSFCLDHDSQDILYNFAYPHPYTIEDIVSAFRTVGGFREPLATVPPKVLALAAIPFELANAVGINNPIHRDRIRKLYESTHIVPQWLLENGFEFGTDLASALGAWKAQSPARNFV